MPYRWEIDGDTLKIAVTYGPLDATFTGRFDEDGLGFRGGLRTNPGADETMTVPYNIDGPRLS